MEELEALLIRAFIQAIVEVLKALWPAALYVLRRPLLWPAAVATYWWAAATDHGVMPSIVATFVIVAVIAATVAVRRSSI